MSIMLTTKDNPFNPLTHFTEWYMFDVEKGYNTCSLLSRIAQTSDSLPDKVNERIVNDAIETIIKELDFRNIYTTVTDEEI